MKVSKMKISKMKTVKRKASKVKVRKVKTRKEKISKTRISRMLNQTIEIQKIKISKAKHFDWKDSKIINWKSSNHHQMHWDWAQDWLDSTMIKIKTLRSINCSKMYQRQNRTLKTRLFVCWKMIFAIRFANSHLKCSKNSLMIEQKKLHTNFKNVHQCRSLQSFEIEFRHFALNYLLISKKRERKSSNREISQSIVATMKWSKNELMSFARSKVSSFV